MFDMTKVVKRAYKYRFYPTPEQAAELSRTSAASARYGTSPSKPAPQRGTSGTNA